MKIEWNKVTWYSKLIAVFVFVMTFCVAFWLGKEYNNILLTIPNDVPTGSYVPNENDNKFTFAVGESKQITSDSIFTLDSIEEDSRCPKGVQCIWAGTIKVKLVLVLAYGGSAKNAIIEINKDPVRLGPYLVSLVKVSPEKNTTSTKYQFTFDIEHMK